MFGTSSLPYTFTTFFVQYFVQCLFSSSMVFSFTHIIYCFMLSYIYDLRSGNRLLCRIYLISVTLKQSVLSGSL